MSEIAYPQLPHENGPPVLRRTWHAAGRNVGAVRMQAAGDVFEGAELWLPQLIPVTSTSVVDIRVPIVEVNGVRVDLEAISIRWRWEPFKWARR